jgi:hypothetical protein
MAGLYLLTNLLTILRPLKNDLMCKFVGIIKINNCMKSWIQFILYLIAQLLIFELIAIEYAKYKLREEKQ